VEYLNVLLWVCGMENERWMFNCRTAQVTFCSTDHPSVAGGDLCAIDRTAQSNVADLVWRTGVSTTESWWLARGEETLLLLQLIGSLVYQLLWHLFYWPAILELIRTVWAWSAAVAVVIWVLIIITIKCEMGKNG